MAQDRSALHGILPGNGRGKRNLTRVYLAEALRPGAECRLPPASARHVARVLRLAQGDALTVFNGDGAEYEAVVARVYKGEVAVRIGDVRAATRESALEIVLGQALSSGERMDFTVQKAVELGVAAIHPLSASRSVVRLEAERAKKRVLHWQSVAIAACEQCGRNRVPTIAPVAALEDWLAHQGTRRADELRVLLSPQSETRLRDLHKPNGGIVMLAGPEGGFTREEEGLARRHGYIQVRLGPRVLRTETAAVAALAAMQTLWGDF